MRITILVLFAVACAGCSTDRVDAPTPEGIAAARERQRADARVIISDVCTLQHAFDEILSTKSKPEASWPEDAKLLYEKLIEFLERAHGDAIDVKDAARRIADGDTSTAAIDELNGAQHRLAILANAVSANQGTSTATIALSEWVTATRQAIDNRLAAAEEDRREQERLQFQRETGYGLGVTMAGYLRLRDGMSQSEVSLILDNFNAKQVSSAGSYSTYVWQDGYRIISVSFDHGALIAKAQSGL